MKITKVRVKLEGDPCGRLKAYCSVTFDDCLALHDLKVIRGPCGLFVAMPSRKATDKCPHCSTKTPLDARFCTNCGKKLVENRVPVNEDGRRHCYYDIAHPISQEFRVKLERRVIQAYGEELARAQQPWHPAYQRSCAKV